MSKKKLGLSLGLASIIAVGTFASPFISSADIAANSDKTKSEEVSSNKGDKTVLTINHKLNGANNVISNDVIQKAKDTMLNAGLNSDNGSDNVGYVKREAVQYRVPREVKPIRYTRMTHDVEIEETANDRKGTVKEREVSLDNAANNDTKENTTKEDATKEDAAKDISKEVLTNKESNDDTKTTKFDTADSSNDTVKEDINEKTDINENNKTVDYSNDNKDNTYSEENNNEYKEKTQVVKEETYVEDQEASNYAGQKENEYYGAKSLVGGKQAEINALEGQLYNSKPSTNEGEEESESSYNSNAEEIRGRINSLRGELEGLKANASRLQQEAAQARSVAESKKRVEFVDKEVKVKVPVKKATTPKTTINTPSVPKKETNNSYVPNAKKTTTSDTSSVVSSNKNNNSSETTKTNTKDNDIIPNENAIKAKITGAVYVRAAASSSAKILGILQKGTEIQGVQDDYWTQVSFNGMLGYVYNGYVAKIGKATGIKKITTTSNTAVSNRSANTVSTTTDANKVTTDANKVTNDKTDAEVKDKNEKDTGKATTGSKSAEAVAKAAYDHLGKKYVWGATGPSQFDCSGLTQYLYKNVAGVTINRVSRDQAKNGYQVSKNSLKSGDLLFFNNGGGPISHVGIYVGDGQMIHASSPTTGVIKSNVLSGYFANTFVTARRILN